MESLHRPAFFCCSCMSWGTEGLRASDPQFGGGLNRCRVGRGSDLWRTRSGVDCWISLWGTVRRTKDKGLFWWAALTKPKGVSVCFSRNALESHICCSHRDPPPWKQEDWAHEKRFMKSLESFCQHQPGFSGFLWRRKVYKREFRDTGSLKVDDLWRPEDFRTMLIMMHHQTISHHSEMLDSGQVRTLDPTVRKRLFKKHGSMEAKEEDTVEQQELRETAGWSTKRLSVLSFGPDRTEHLCL